MNLFNPDTIGWELEVSGADGFRDVSDRATVERVEMDGCWLPVITPVAYSCDWDDDHPIFSVDKVDGEFEVFVGDLENVTAVSNTGSQL